MATSYAIQVLQPGVVLGTVDSVVTPAIAQNAVIRAATFANVTGSAVTLTLSIKRSGVAAQALLSARVIQANDTLVCRELVNQMLAPGDTLLAHASAAAALNVFITGVVF